MATQARKSLEWLASDILIACLAGFAGSVPGSKSAMGFHIAHTAYAFYAASVVPHNEDIYLASFQNIMETCIINANSYGGQMTSTGELYNLTNFNYPGSPLDDEGRILPDGPLAPKPGKGCPGAGLKKNVTFKLSAGNSKSVFQDLDLNSFPDMFTKETQWRFFAQDVTVIKAWSVDFHGNSKANIKITDDGTVASFEVPDPLPCKSSCIPTIAIADKTPSENHRNCNVH